jgi:hypothetical protein
MSSSTSDPSGKRDPAAYRLAQTLRAGLEARRFGTTFLPQPPPDPPPELCAAFEKLAAAPPLYSAPPLSVEPLPAVQIGPPLREAQELLALYSSTDLLAPAIGSGGGLLGRLLRPVRRILRAFLRPWLDVQSRFNRQAAIELIELERFLRRVVEELERAAHARQRLLEVVGGVHGEVHRELAKQARFNEDLLRVLVIVERDLNLLGQQARHGRRALQEAILSLQSEIAEEARLNQALRDRVAALEERLRQLEPGEPPQTAAGEAA